MIKQSVKKWGILMILSLSFSTASYSQFKDVDFLRSSPADAVTYVQAYLSPWLNAFGSGLSGNWYNTAKPHKFGGFDITTGISVGIVPSSATTFDLSKIGLSPSLSGTGVAPTIAGPKEEGPLMYYKVNNLTLASFNAPKGTDWRYIPVPIAQVGIGLPLGTELKGRFIPKININDGDVALWGVGIIHSIMQYIPGHKALPLDVSLFAGYTKLMGDVPLGLKPEAGVAQSYVAPYNTTTAFDNQNLKMSAQSLNISVISSVDLKVITFYGGLGYCKSKTTIEMQGDYPTPVYVTTPLPGHVEYNNSGVKQGKDYPKLNVENFSGLRANIGFRIKLAVVTFHADYTRAQYNVVSAGLGLSFR
jgi:hypothetical protein